MIIFSFTEWLMNELRQTDSDGRPVQLDLIFPNGETKPPVCRRTGIEFDGPGLVCFDFDQTLTTAWFGHPENPSDRENHSTKNPNPHMMSKVVEQHRSRNKLIIVTARGEKEGQMTSDKSHHKGLQPILTPDKTLSYSGAIHVTSPERDRDWHPDIKNNNAWLPLVMAMKPSDVFHLGPVSVGSIGEDKGPFIASKMVKFGHKWGILYDDGPSNIESANMQQKRGIPLAGISVEQNYEPDGKKPVGVVAQRSLSGM